MNTLIIRWLGHASFQIRTDEKIIYIDPYEGEYSTKADLILVTHSHFDHCDPIKIEKIRKADTRIIAPIDCALKIGEDVETLKSREEADIHHVKVKAVDAYNHKRFRSPGNPFHPKGFGVGYMITIEGKRVYHAGDTDFIPEMKKLGQVDVALLPSGDTYTMNNTEASDAVIAIRPKIAIPMHRWDTDPQEFKKRVEANSNVKVLILQKGEEYKLVQ